MPEITTEQEWVQVTVTACAHWMADEGLPKEMIDRMVARVAHGGPRLHPTPITTEQEWTEEVARVLAMYGRTDSPSLLDDLRRKVVGPLVERAQAVRALADEWSRKGGLGTADELRRALDGDDA